MAGVSGIVGDPPLEVPITPQTVRVEAILTYSSADHAQDLDVVLAEPGTDGLCVLVVPCVGNLPALTWTDPPAGWHENMNGTLGSPDSPSTMALESRALGSFCDCTWTALAYSRVPLTAAVKFSLEVTVWEQP
ncbi:MAG: hypothetical protein LC623_05955 [Halobacteriales archaeon]|nr:hypothetical protein [Halobacteriales archaeon]